MSAGSVVSLSLAWCSSLSVCLSFSLVKNLCHVPYRYQPLDERTKPGPPFPSCLMMDIVSFYLFGSEKRETQTTTPRTSKTIKRRAICWGDRRE